MEDSFFICDFFYVKMESRYLKWRRDGIIRLKKIQRGKDGTIRVFHFNGWTRIVVRSIPLEEQSSIKLTHWEFSSDVTVFLTSKVTFSKYDDFFI